MKREGRQHGMVRTYRILPSPWNPKPDSRFINRFDSPPTAGLFAKVHPRPTNHSKFTGKCTRPRCNGCHMQPCCKSKDKTKGNEKLKSFDVASNYRSITWRVVDGRPGLNFSGFSATEILDHLANEDDYLDYEIDGDYDNYWEKSKVEDQKDEEEEEEENDGLSYCDVGFQVDQIEGDDDWCLVAEM